MVTKCSEISDATSCIRWLKWKSTNVSRTISVLIITKLTTRTEMVLKILGSLTFQHLTQLAAQGSFTTVTDLLCASFPLVNIYTTSKFTLYSQNVTFTQGKLHIFTISFHVKCSSPRCNNQFSLLNRQVKHIFCAVCALARYQSCFW